MSSGIFPVGAARRDLHRAARRLRDPCRVHRRGVAQDLRRRQPPEGKLQSVRARRESDHALRDQCRAVGLRDLVRVRARATRDDRQPASGCSCRRSRTRCRACRPGMRKATPNCPLSLASCPSHQRHVEPIGLREHVRAELRDQEAARGRRRAAEHVGDDCRAVALAGTGRDVVLGHGPVGAAGIDRGVVPLELVERFHRAEAEAPVRVGHRDRQQYFLELGPGPARGRARRSG